MTEGQLEQETLDWPCMQVFGPGIADNTQLMTGI